jgi:hypothetical protein
MEGRGGGEAQGVADPKKNTLKIKWAVNKQILVIQAITVTLNFAS